MTKIPSDYNAMCRYLGLPEEPDCEQCGIQIRTYMESPFTLLVKGEAHRFCNVDCLNAWSAERRGPAGTDSPAPTTPPEG